MYEQDVLLELRKLEAEITELQNELKKFPPGNLTVTKNKASYKWYITNDKSRTYLPKSDKSTAEALARKKYFSLKLNELLSQHEFLTSYLRNHSKPQSESENLLSQIPYYELLKSHFQPKNERLSKWSNFSYERNSSFPEHLIHRSLSSNLVRSKSEAMIDTALFQHSIPFRYECILHLSDNIIYPDFTILHPGTEKILYWEHFGMMDDPGYARNAFSKLQAYQANNIIPGINLITTYETKNAPLSTNLVEKTIHFYFH